MPDPDLTTMRFSGEFAARPSDADLDLFGLTHIGKVRTENQDHFLLATVHPQVKVHASSLTLVEPGLLTGERVATLMLVADGVGGGVAGAEASQLAVETITHYVSHTLRCYHVAGANDDELENALRAAAFAAHDAVRAERVARDESRPMATTLTIALAVWPWAYIVQVGDSRCYLFQEGEMRQLTRDQTVAQALVDEGVMDESSAARSPFGNVLASAIGSDEAKPEVRRVSIRARSLFLLCSDGLTKHVTNDEISDEIRRHTSSDALCRSLLDLALARGGSDNVTVLAAQAKGAVP
jgi:protein phosphatase